MAEMSDLVAEVEDGAGVALRDQVDRLGGAAHEDDLLAVGGVEEVLHRVARRLEGLGGALAEGVHAAVDVGVVGGVETRDGVDHRARLLRRGGVVEVDERLAVHLLGEDREVGAQAVHRRRAARPLRTGMGGRCRHAAWECLHRQAQQGHQECLGALGALVLNWQSRVE